MDPRCTEACREIFLPRDYCIADLSVSVAALCPDQAVRGRCLVTLREHVAELFQRTPAMRAVFLEDVARVAEVLFRTLAPVKIDDALLGNVVPACTGTSIPAVGRAPGRTASTRARSGRWIVHGCSFPQGSGAS